MLGGKQGEYHGERKYRQEVKTETGEAHIEPVRLPVVSACSAQGHAKPHDATGDGRNQCALIGTLQGGAPRFVYEIRWKGARARHLCADMQYCGKPANQAPHPAKDSSWRLWRWDPR